MKSIIKVCFAVIIFCTMITTQPAFCENGFHNPLMNLNLSPEQMLSIQDVFEEFSVVENELLNLNLGLTYDQVKKILKNRAKRDKKEINLKLKSSLKLIDLQKEMVQEQRENDKINKIVLKITELGTEQLDNRVVHFLKAKDILTLDQKKKLFHAVLMMPNY
jgi:hypothetical protein